MDWFDRKAKPNDAENAFPLGARLKGAVAIDALPFRLAGEAFGFECPQGPQIIEAIGVIDLGDGAQLHRLYLTDDAFLQIATNGAAGSERSVGDVALFVYVDSVHPANQAAFRQWVQQGSLLGAESYALANRQYHRIWGEGDWSPPIVLDETVHKTSASLKDYDLTLYSMLYERTPDGVDRNELLLVAAEDSGPNQYVVSLALGVPLTTAEFEIT